MLDRAREAALGGLANADLPFEKLVEELRPERSMSHAPVFQTQLIVLNTPQGALDLAGTRAASLHVDSGTAKFDLSLVAEVGGEDALRLAIEYDTALFDAATVERFGRHLTHPAGGGRGRPGPAGRRDRPAQRGRALADGGRAGTPPAVSCRRRRRRWTLLDRRPRSWAIRR